MATNFPSSLDVFTNPTSTSSMSGALSHAGQHSDLNDAVEALQAKVGADSSAVTSSHDYLIADHASRITTLEGASGGKILQVVTTTKTDTFSASVASGAVSGAVISATITPTSANSKVLILAQVSPNCTTNTSLTTLYRGGSILSGASGNTAGSRQVTTSRSHDSGSNGLATNTVPIMYLDSPATTSATTYDIRLGHGSAVTQTVYLNRSDSDPDSVYGIRTISSITLVEVST